MNNSLKKKIPKELNYFSVDEVYILVIDNKSPAKCWCPIVVGLSVRPAVRPSGKKEMVKSILQYLHVGVINSPNLQQLFILTWSTDTWWFVSLTYISRFSDQDTK